VDPFTTLIRPLILARHASGDLRNPLGDDGLQCLAEFGKTRLDLLDGMPPSSQRRSLSLSQLSQQCFRRPQIGRREAFGKATIDGCQQIPGRS
jgi:hypothetical protein